MGIGYRVSVSFRPYYQAVVFVSEMLKTEASVVLVMVVVVLDSRIHIVAW